MARPTLTEQEKAIRDAEKAELNSDKRKYNRKPAPVIEKNQEIQTQAPMETNDVTAQETSSATNEGGGTPNKRFKPWAGKRVEREYSSPKIDLTLANIEIPEAPTATTNSSASAHDSLRKPINPQPQPTTAQTISQNMGTSQLNPLEQKESAERAVEGAISLYEQGWSWGRMAVKVSENDLAKRHRENKLDMHGMFLPPHADPRGRGQTIKEFFEDYNKQVDSRLIVTEEFKNKVRPPAIRIFQKFGIGLSDEKYLAGIVIQDIIEKGSMIYQLKTVVNSAFAFAEQNHQNLMAMVDERVAEKLRQQNTVEKKANEAMKSAEPQTKEPETTSAPVSEVKQEVKEEKLVNLVISQAEGGDLKT